jgi:tetratricopeptide (TPR) repeat protein
MNLSQRYHSWRNKGKRAIQRGDFPLAEKHFRESLADARALGDARLQDLAVCNLCAALIEQNRTDEPEILQLRPIYMRSSDPKIVRLSAYHLARALELQRDFAKAQFYARIALDRSAQLKRADFVASSHNQMGNILTCQSYFGEAAAHYAKALAALPADYPILQALVTDNLGYCRIALGEAARGVSLCEEALGILETHDASPGFLIYPHMDLSLGHLELGRLDRAVEHGRMALEIARYQNHTERIKNILLLLGEAHAKLGAMDAAQAYYGELATFFPEVRIAADFLMAFELRKVVNFRL